MTKKRIDSIAKNESRKLAPRTLNDLTERAIVLGLQTQKVFEKKERVQVGKGIHLWVVKKNSKEDHQCLCKELILYSGDLSSECGCNHYPGIADSSSKDLKEKDYHKHLLGFYVDL
jgi:hypothetical protein